MPVDPHINRRRFFREGLRELLRPLARAVEPLSEAARQFERFNGPPAPRQRVELTILRPPGALAEADFLSACSLCGECVRVCPAQCIVIDVSGAKGRGAPYIEPDVMPCVLCDGLQCMSHCPSGALVVTALADINMGTAVWNSDTCLRKSGEDCTVCVDRCPVGTAAIKLTSGRIEVVEEGCTGCGVCQHACPTSPKSIAVTPREEARRRPREGGEGT